MNDNIAIQARKLSIDFRKEIYELVKNLAEKDIYLDVAEVCKSAHYMQIALNKVSGD